MQGKWKTLKRSFKKKYWHSIRDIRKIKFLLLKEQDLNALASLLEINNP